jgi:hypothetical protein
MERVSKLDGTGESAGVRKRAVLRGDHIRRCCVILKIILNTEEHIWSGLATLQDRYRVRSICDVGLLEKCHGRLGGFTTSVYGDQRFTLKIASRLQLLAVARPFKKP